MFRARTYVLYGDIYISVKEQSRKLKFSMQTKSTHINIIHVFEHCHTSVILDSVDDLYLDDGNVCITVLKNNTAT